MEALNYQIAQKTFRRIVVDSTHVFKRVSRNRFLEILNKQDPAMKYTVELEDQKHSLNFLDINNPTK